jgi:SOS-response transcriptional repressor LexA
MQIQLRKPPMPDTDLTPRQTEILRLIQRAVQATGMPPTRKEIADELGFRSPNAAEEHLRARGSSRWCPVPRAASS